MSGYGSTGSIAAANPLHQKGVQDAKVVFVDMLRHQRFRARLRDKAEDIPALDKDEADEADDLVAEEDLDEGQRRFLLQIASCLISVPNDIPLMVTLWVLRSFGRVMHQPRITVSVGSSCTTIALSGGLGAVLVAAPQDPRPCMRDLSDMLLLINAYLDLPGGPSKRCLAKLSAQVAVILKRKHPYAPWTYPLGVALIAAGYCPVFNGGLIETGLAAVVAVALASLSFWKRLNSQYISVYYIIMGVVATLVPLAVHTRTPLNVMATALAVLMWWLPGSQIMSGVRHLATDYPGEGLAMLANALSVCFMLAFGMGAGFSCARGLGIDVDSINDTPQFPVPPWTLSLFLVLATFGAMLLKQASPQHALPMLLASLGGYYATTWSQPVLAVYSPLAGGFMVQLVAVGHAMVTRQPVFPIITIGMLPIVPGSAALDGVFAGMQTSGGGGVSGSLSFLGSMFLISFCIYIGTAAFQFGFGWVRHHRGLLRACNRVTPQAIIVGWGHTGHGLLEARL